MDPRHKAEVNKGPFAFAGIWQHYRGPLKADGETVERDVHSILTTTPNELVTTIHPNRIPVMLTTEDEFDYRLNGAPDEARGLIRSYPAEEMRSVQSGPDRKDPRTDSLAFRQSDAAI